MWFSPPTCCGSRVRWALPLLTVSALAQVGVASPNASSTGDGVIRAPAGGSEIVITTTQRLAGAIHSLRWNGREQ